jgi:exopolysaccharide biosynthesis protein
VLAAKYPKVRKYFFVFSLYLLCSPVFAQVDSVAISSAQWQITKLAKGVSWLRYHFKRNELFSANQHLSVVKIAENSTDAKLALGYSDSLEYTSTICRRYGAIAGINGSFFRMKGPDPDHQPVGKASTNVIKKHIGNRSVVYLRVADSVITENTFARDSVRRRHQQGIIALASGKLSIRSTAATNLYWERIIAAEDILACGPVMLLNSIAQPIPNDDFCNDRHPRTAVGKMADGTILLVTVDGRTAQSAGMSITELMKVMRWLGCEDAINLDGGGSTTMYVNEQPHRGVVNHPSDNKRFDADGERPVANVLMILPKNNHP